MNLFEGQLVRLAAVDAEAVAPLVAYWTRDSELLRWMSAWPALPISAQAARADQERRAARGNLHGFGIRTLADDRLLGFISLRDFAWTHGEAWVGLNISERADWSRGYGTDALRIALRFAFEELSLMRVALTVLATNERGRRAYAKVGFVAEGRERLKVARDGQRFDVVTMGILKGDWEKSQAGV